MQNKRCKIIILSLLVLLISTKVFAGLPTQAQLDKFCIQARMKIDDDVHNFKANDIVGFTDNGFTILWGKYRENRTDYLREQFYNYDEMKDKHEKLKKEFNL